MLYYKVYVMLADLVYRSALPLVLIRIGIDQVNNQDKVNRRFSAVFL